MGDNLITLAPGAVDYDALVTQLGGLVRDAERTLDVLRGQLDLAIQLRTIAKAETHETARNHPGAAAAAGADRPE